MVYYIHTMGILLKFADLGACQAAAHWSAFVDSFTPIKSLAAGASAQARPHCGRSQSSRPDPTAGGHSAPGQTPLREVTELHKLGCWDN